MTGAPLPPDPGSHRVLADGRTAALLTATAEVDWWCAPDLDSTPLLWSLLDPAGASARWVDVVAADETGPVASPALSTVVRAGGSRVECVDGLVADEDGRPALVRLVRALDAPVELVHAVAVGGFDAPRGEWTTGAAAATAAVAGHDVTVLSTGESSRDGDWLRTRVTAPLEGWGVVVVAVGRAPALEPDALHRRLRHLRDEAERDVDGPFLPRRHAARVHDSLRVLRACTYSDTGAVVASITASLPEAPGADRQFDYRYSWLRDASLAVSVASLLGATGSARAFLAFARAAVAEDPLATPPLLTVRGGTVPAEHDVEGVAGWAGSQPVRVGNDAAGQRQYDALGLLIEAVSVHVQTGGVLDGETWRTVIRIADAVAEEVLSGEHPASNGIWELRTPRLVVNDDIGRWLALDRAVWIARMLRPWHRRRHWLKARDVVRDRVLGVLGDDGSLPQSYDDQTPVPDASALGAAVFGLVDDDDPRAAALVGWVLDRLGADDLVYRYPPAADGELGSDGFHGREGTFLPMAFWAVAALAAVGQVEQAEQRLSRLAARLPRLLPEEVDPVDRRALGNTPLLWSHMALARAVYILQAAQLRRRYGPVGFALWRGVRYVRLRGATDRS